MDLINTILASLFIISTLVFMGLLHHTLKTKRHLVFTYLSAIPPIIFGVILVLLGKQWCFD